MAKTRIMIQMNYRAVKKQAGRLEEIAGSLSKLSKDQLENCFEQIRTGWEGDNAVASIGKGRVIQQDLQTISENLKKTAVTICEIATETYNAEMRALELAKTRTS